MNTPTKPKTAALLESKAGSFCDECDYRIQGEIPTFCPGCDAMFTVIRYASPSESQVNPGASGPAGLTPKPRRPARPLWDETWLRMATAAADRSTCPRKKVGAVLVTQENRVLATGYNGAPSGMPHCMDTDCLLDGENHCVRAIHAEINAILGCTNGTKGSIMYVTHMPCLQCALILVQAKVARVVCPRPAEMKSRYQLALETLREGGVQVDFKE